MQKHLRTIGEKIFDAINVVFLGLLSISFLLPILVAYSSSLTNEIILIQKGYQVLPVNFSLDAYNFLFRSGNNFLSTLTNSGIITILGTIISLAFTVFLAYGLSIKDLPYKRAITIGVVFTMYFSGGIIPSYIVYKMYGITNTLFVQYIMWAVSPFYMIMMRNFFQLLPEEMFEASRIDGAGEFRIFSQIILPLAKPMLATLIILYGVMYWNDWVSFTYYCSKQNVMPLQVLMQRMMQYADEFLTSQSASQTQAQGIIPKEGIKMAMVVIITFPIIVTYPVLQKYFVTGMTIGAVKG